MFLVYICKGNTKVFIIKMFSRKTLLKVLHLTFIKYCLSNIIVLFTFVYNSLISVIYYKVYNEPPGVGTATKILISVIYYNVYNVMGWAPGSRKGGTGAILHAWHHRGTRQGAKVQRATLHTRHHRGTRQGAKVARVQYSMPGSIEAPGRAQRCNGRHSTPGTIEAPGRAQRCNGQHSTPGTIEAPGTGANKKTDGQTAAGS